MRQSSWYPLIPSHMLRASDNIVAGFAKGQELALWRSQEGVVQVWENRCPHRGTRLTLGRIINDKLSCAYHGWEFGSNGGKCASIPAHPNTPAPKQLCIKTFRASEAEGMVWVSYDLTSTSVQPICPESVEKKRAFVATLGVRAGLDDTLKELTTQGFKAETPFSWSGALAGRTGVAFLTESGPDLTFIHLWLNDTADTKALDEAMAASRRLRCAIEARTASRS